MTFWYSGWYHMDDKQQPSTNEGVILDNREDVHKQLYLALNEYHFGRITFLELLDKWEEILHISPPHRGNITHSKRSHER